MKKLNLKSLSTFKSCQIENTANIKGGCDGGDDQCDDPGIIGADDIIDG